MILIIDKSKKERESVQDMLYYMGILSRAVSPAEAVGEISELYRAVLFTSATGLSDEAALAEELKRSCNIPIYALSGRNIDYAMATFMPDIYSSELIREISKIEVAEGREPMGVYRLAGIDASVEIGAAEVFGHKLGYTKTETMILRTLIKLYPSPTLPKEILKYAFRQSRVPDMPSVRTHISVMNKKYTRVMGRALTMPPRGGGYVIATPEMRREEKERCGLG